MRKCICLVIGLVLAWNPGLSADICKEDLLVSLSAGFSETKYKLFGREEDNVTFMVEGEYFFSDHFSLGVRGARDYSERNFVEKTGYYVGASFRYHFLTDTFCPYLGAQVNYVRADIDYDGFLLLRDADVGGIMWGPMLGIKFDVSDAVLLFYEYHYRSYAGDIEDHLDEENNHMVGVAFRF